MHRIYNLDFSFAVVLSLALRLQLGYAFIIQRLSKYTFLIIAHTRLFLKTQLLSLFLYFLSFSSTNTRSVSFIRFLPFVFLSPHFPASLHYFPFFLFCMTLKCIFCYSFLNLDLSYLVSYF